ncbi:transmembrane protein [Thalictrum thalictroides]|uniref:Transmembrane protein n=1 Tax=Thalictrum thalictroides TaxID=46969 RepID=A0A7J6V3I0_THATH|nr:transmembrane protein [Thalictrum thalictroides]
MAKYFSGLQTVMEILREVIGLPRRNKKIFFFIFLSTLIPYFLLIFATIYSLKTIITDLSMITISLVRMNPKSAEYVKQFTKMKEDSMFIILVEVMFFFLMSAVSLFSMVATIHVSAMSYLDRDLTLKDLFSKFKKNWFRPVITWFYFTLMSAGYFVVILPLYVLLVLTKESFVVAAVGIVLALLVMSFLNIYLVIVWMLSLVISVLEGCYGLQALGKGEQLMKGRRGVGFGLTFISVVLLGANFFLATISKHHQTVTIRFLIMSVMLTLAILVKISSMMMYTIFYFDCKQCHGEHVEIEEKEYIFTKLDDTALP